MLTQERLKELLHYNPETGIFTRVMSISNVKRGVIAGSCDRQGYLIIKVEGKNRKAHRLAWLYVYGEFPKGEIDHINHKTSDNRICNLRDVSVKENQHNQHRAHITSPVKFLGVSLDKRSGKYRSQIKVNGKSISLGNFKTPEEAHQVYLEAKLRLHTTCQYVAEAIRNQPSTRESREAETDKHKTSY